VFLAGVKATWSRSLGRKGSAHSTGAGTRLGCLSVDSAEQGVTPVPLRRKEFSIMINEHIFATTPKSCARDLLLFLLCL
jgi:hypothetical protein